MFLLLSTGKTQMTPEDPFIWPENDYSVWMLCCGNFIDMTSVSWQIRIRDPNQGGRDITEEIMSGVWSAAINNPQQVECSFFLLIYAMSWKWFIKVFYLFVYLFRYLSGTSTVTLIICILTILLYCKEHVICMMLSQFLLLFHILSLYDALLLILPIV